MFAEDKQNRRLSKRNLHNQVAHELGLRIVSGIYPQGSVLPNEHTLSTEFNVSRTAYREGLKLLSAKGLIESRPKIGSTIKAKAYWNTLDPDILHWIFAAGPEPKDIQHLFELRCILEPAAAGLAALRRTQQQLDTIEQHYNDMAEAGSDIDRGLTPDLLFHRAIFSASGNDLLSPMVFLIESALAHCIKISSRDPETRLSAIPLHYDVFCGIKNQNQAQASAAMLKLLQEANQDIKLAISQENEGA